MPAVTSPKITPFLWFDNNAQDAIRFYTSIFKNSKIIQLHPMVSTFELEGQRFMALNGGPHHTFTEAISLFVNCDSQEEIDFFWDRLLSNGGRPDRCGWLKDRFGLSWQIVPSILGKLMSNTDQGRTKRVMDAMLGMVKLDIAGLQKAYDQR
jgi:predicted 3-demethylubiquinone-9 3-methyltransferase (glyoxalase superfamily)